MCVIKLKDYLAITSPVFLLILLCTLKLFILKTLRLCFFYCLKFTMTTISPDILQALSLFPNKKNICFEIIIRPRYEKNQHKFAE